MILCDSNIIIEVYRNNPGVISELKEIGQSQTAISVITAYEIVYGAFNKKELTQIKNDFQKLLVITLNENICNKALQLMFDFSLSHKLSLPDSLIAATSLYYRYE